MRLEPVFKPAGLPATTSARGEVPLRLRAAVVAGVLGFLCATHEAAAAGPALVFEKTELEHQADPAEEVVIITYQYQNKSAHPVRLTGGETNCDCLKAVPDKEIVPPGEWGELKAWFSLGALLGRHRQRVTLLTEENGRAQRYDLFVIMEIPVLIEIEPDVMRWTVGDDPVEQVFDIRMTGEEPLEVTDISSTRPGFDWKLETVEEGRHFRLRVRPEKTVSPTMGAMRIQTNSPVPKYQRALAYFIIQPPDRATGGSTP